MELTIEQALQQGVAAHKEGKPQDAERLYHAILQSQPGHPASLPPPEFASHYQLVFWSIMEHSLCRTILAFFHLSKFRNLVLGSNCLSRLQIERDNDSIRLCGERNSSMMKRRRKKNYVS